MKYLIKYHWWLWGLPASFIRSWQTPLSLPRLNAVPRDKLTACALDKQVAQGCDVSGLRIFYIESLLLRPPRKYKIIMLELRCLHFLWNHAQLSSPGLLLASFGLKSETTPVGKCVPASIPKTQSFCFSHSSSVWRNCTKWEMRSLCIRDISPRTTRPWVVGVTSRSDPVAKILAIKDAALFGISLILY